MSAAPRPAADRGDLRALAILLALGLGLRLLLAYLLPGSGFRGDLASFQAWAGNLAAMGPWGFYERPFLHDYPPGYMYVLWALGEARVLLAGAGGLGDWIKAPAIIADLVLAALVHSMLLELGVTRRRALIGAAIVLFIPITWFDSVVWGQVDSVGVVFMVLGLRALWRDDPEQAAVWAAIAAVIKPQLGILVPIVAGVTIARYVFRRGPEDDAPEPVEPPEGAVFGAIGRWKARHRGPVRIVTTGLVGLVTAAILAAPFKLSVLDLIRQVGVAAGGYPYLTVNAYNLWALVQHEGQSMATNWGFQCDAIASAGSCIDPANATLLGPFWAVAVGTTLLLVAIAAITFMAARHPSRLTILVALACLALAFFVVPTRVHERYLFPLVPLAAILAVVSSRWAAAMAAVAVATFLNMYAVLTTVYQGNPQISDWLGIGPDIRGTMSVTLIAVTHTVVFLFAVAQLRGSGRRRLADELVDAGPIPADHEAWPALVPDVGPALALGAVRPMAHDAASPAERAPPPPTAPGYVERILGRPIRPDRSPSLEGETGGRLDATDLVVFLLVVIAAMTMRTVRLDQPATMMFDEVYHARTATEFLQDWRYGQPHEIYEYTHPHLAKYAMAVGIALFSDDKIGPISRIGATVTDAAVEPRYLDPTAPSGIDGDRLYVATGEEVRVFGLGSRALQATIAWPGARAVAVDPTNHRLYVASADGAIGVVETQVELDPLAAGGPVQSIAATPLLTIDGPIAELHATADGSALVARTTYGEIVSIDPAAAIETGRRAIDGASAIVDAGTTDSLVAVPAEVADPDAAASSLAAILGGASSDYRSRLTSAGERVDLGPIEPSLHDAVAEAIADGRLTGLQLASGARIAVAGGAGVTLLAAGSAGQVGFVATEHPATGLALVDGVDAGQDLYVATGAGITKVSVDPGVAPAVVGQVFLPAMGRSVLFDVSTRLVHVLGARPDGQPGWTVYAIEPHGDATFADTPLPYEPAAWVIDEAAQFPASDRQQLLALSADGSVASAYVGGYAAGWRVPGVFAAALMAGLLYVLARILFRRRSVAVAAAAFGLADGMFFAQARIGMNDSYVALFIVAAYTLLAWLLAEPDRRRRAFWVAMPVIGVLLGLALSSKWVAAYAIAGAVVLVLGRSALGRIGVILAMIAGTVVLGSIAVAVEAGPTAGPNWTFFAIMVALTLVSVVITVARPIVWSPEEVRFAVAAPVVAGVALWGVAVAVGYGQQAAPIGFALIVLGGLAYGAFHLARLFGFGPLAATPAPDDPVRLLPPAAPPPAPWLRLGSSLGLPALWGAISLLVVPVVVYVISYLPWVALGFRLTPSWPADHTRITLIELTQQMYDYHDRLRAAHVASSPWWAWPFDLKPVWFYSGSFAGQTAAAVYDTGSLVVFWLGVAAIVYAAWQSWVRRSPALAIIAIAFAWQWLPWSRIDRATFQYHYYTALPFVILALGYLAAELWHGPSRRTWLGIRVVAAAAIVAPAAMWLLRSPMCAAFGVERARQNSEVCAPDPGALTNVVSILGEGMASFLRAFPPEQIALVGVALLGVVAWFALSARDSRRFVGGMVVAAVVWFVAWYPNIGALALPARFYNWYQGVLPTWNWAFQFPVNLEPAAQSPPIVSLDNVILAGALGATCLIVGYATWSWRLAAAERRAAYQRPDRPMAGGPAPGAT